VKRVFVFLTIALLIALTPPAHAQQTNGTATVLQNANLRGGPGTNFALVGRVTQGDTVKVDRCNPDCDWYELSDGSWIAAFLVELAATPAPPAEPITVVSWNTELNDADIAVISDRIVTFQGVDLWGLVEVNRASHQIILEAAAEMGESADFGSVLSVSGAGDRLLALYDAERFDLLDSWEETEINTTGNARAALVLELREQRSNTRFLFMVNHLYRSREDERRQQAQLLNAWAARQTLPVIAVGDYNFDWEVAGTDHDAGYDLLTVNDRFRWVRPATLVTTQCSGWPCTFNSVLDFVFTAGAAQAWRAESEIVVTPGDFPDDDTTSDHRPLLARFWPDAQVIVTPPPPTRPTATPLATGPTANSSANLRTGPGTNYAVAGSIQQGQALRIVGRNATGDWVQLDSGSWIAAFLVNSVPTGLNVIEAPALPTPIPVPPTATPVPAQPVAPPPPAAPSGEANVIIRSIFYDGLVSRVESDEYAEIANVGSAAINLGGWRLNAGDNGQDFRFPSVELGPGQSVRVYTNQIHPESGGFSFGKGSAIWNNKGDCGVLFDGGGQVVAERCY
jgi:uncharacterized protein YraI